MIQIQTYMHTRRRVSTRELPKATSRTSPHPPRVKVSGRRTSPPAGSCVRGHPKQKERKILRKTVQRSSRGSSGKLPVRYLDGLGETLSFTAFSRRNINLFLKIRLRSWFDSFDLDNNCKATENCAHSTSQDGVVLVVQIASTSFTLGPSDSSGKVRLLLYAFDTIN